MIDDQTYGPWISLRLVDHLYGLALTKYFRTFKRQSHLHSIDWTTIHPILPWFKYKNFNSRIKQPSIYNPSFTLWIVVSLFGSTLGRTSLNSHPKTITYRPSLDLWSWFGSVDCFYYHFSSFLSQPLPNKFHAKYYIKTLTN